MKSRYEIEHRAPDEGGEKMYFVWPKAFPRTYTDYAISRHYTRKAAEQAIDRYTENDRRRES